LRYPRYPGLLQRVAFPQRQQNTLSKTQFRPHPKQDTSDVSQKTCSTGKGTPSILDERTTPDCFCLTSAVDHRQSRQRLACKTCTNFRVGVLFWPASLLSCICASRKPGKSPSQQIKQQSLHRSDVRRSDNFRWEIPATMNSRRIWTPQRI